MGPDRSSGPFYDPRSCGSAVEKKGQGARDTRQRIEETARRQHIIPEAAALVVAHRQGLDTAPFLPSALKAVKKA